MKAAVKERPATIATGDLCAGESCLNRMNNGLAFCDRCLELRRRECLASRADPNFRSWNYACSYQWHARVVDCPLCRKDGTYGKGGCEPCAKCHYCNSVHVEPAAA